MQWPASERRGLGVDGAGWSRSAAEAVHDRVPGGGWWASGRFAGRGWVVVVGAVAGWIGGAGLPAGQGPAQSAVGEAVHAPARCLVAEPVVVAAQAAQVGVAGRAGRPGKVVVEVAADRRRAAAGEAA